MKREAWCGELGLQQSVLTSEGPRRDRQMKPKSILLLGQRCLPWDWLWEKCPPRVPGGGRTWVGAEIPAETDWFFFFFGNRQRQFNVHPSPHIHVLRTLCNACSKCEEIVAQIPFLRVIDGEGRHPASPLLATRWHFRPANLSDWALPPGRHLVAMYFPIVG